MAENLDVDHFRTGDPIPEVRLRKEWATLTTGAWCTNLKDPRKHTAFGRIYNWYAVNDERGLAPAGWHIPSIDEWEQLLKYLDETTVSKQELHVAATNHRRYNKSKLTNEIGFTVLPAGCRSSDSRFSHKDATYLWTSSEMDEDSAWYWYPGFLGFEIGSNSKRWGCSVRCIMN